MHHYLRYITKSMRKCIALVSFRSLAICRCEQLNTRATRLSLLTSGDRSHRRHCSSLFNNTEATSAMVPEIQVAYFPRQKRVLAACRRLFFFFLLVSFLTTLCARGASARKTGDEYRKGQLLVSGCEGTALPLLFPCLP